MSEYHETPAVAKLLSLGRQMREQAQAEQDINQALQQRDDLIEILDQVCDAVLGEDRPEWSSHYGYADAVADVKERIANLQQQADRYAVVRAHAGLISGLNGNDGPFFYSSMRVIEDTQPMSPATKLDRSADDAMLTEFYRTTFRTLSDSSPDQVKP